MNDLSKKEANIGEHNALESNSPSENHSSSARVFRKKLEHVTLLLYQAYLKGETMIEPDTRSVLLGLVKQDDDFAFKVRMMQLDYLNLENKNLDGEWNESDEVLFPSVAPMNTPIDRNRKKLLREYEESISELIRLSRNTGSQSQ